MHKYFLWALFLLVASVLLTQAVDKTKFKSCEQSSFCKRHRSLSDEWTEKLNFEVVPHSFIQDGSSKIKGKIQSPFGAQLPIELTALQHGIVRFTITDENPKRFTGPKEVLLDTIQESQFTSFAQESDGIVFGLEDNGNKIKGVLKYSPLILELYVNDELKIVTNKRGLFNFEHLRNGKEDDNIPAKIKDHLATKPEEWNENEDGVWEAPEIDNPLAAGRWEEDYGGNKDTKPRGPQDFGLDFTFVNSKHVFGVPEHAIDLSLKKTKGEGISRDPYRLYNLDVFEYILDSEMALYGAIPLLISLHSSSDSTPTFSGVFWLNSAETWIDVADGENGIDTHWFSESGILDVFLLPGPTIKNDFYRQYTSLTGVTDVPPMWSLGYHQCKWNYRDEKEVAEVDDGFDQADIPYDVIWLDIEHTNTKKYFTWDPNHFPTPDIMLKDLAVKGRELVTIVDPHIKRESGYYVHELSTSKDIYVKSKDNNIYEGSCWPGSSSWIDYLNPKARNFWESLYTYNNYEKSQSNLYIWNDMNEPSVFSGPEITMPKDNLHLEGKIEHRDVHNVYGFYMHRSTYRGLIKRNENKIVDLNSGGFLGSVFGTENTENQQDLVEEKGLRPFILTRSFFAGSQRYAAVWTGDNAAEWGHLKVSVPMLLSISVSGLPFIGADVGGFFGNPEKELLLRWYQTAAFTPFFRGHGHIDSRRREPFLFEDPWKSLMQEAIRKRYSYLPYLYTNFYNHFKTGLPVMRPLWMEFESDKDTWENEQQFMLGSDLMISPVLDEGVTNLKIYFPKISTNGGFWYDVETGAKYVGGKTVDVSTPLEKVPVYQRGGSIIAKKERPRRSTQAMRDDPITLVVALDENGQSSGTVYFDDERTFDYKNGKFLTYKFEYVNGVLKGSKLDGDYDTKVWIEKIVFLGKKEIARAVLLEKDSDKTNLSTEITESIVAIRKPGVALKDSTWQITI